ncbi:DEAD/DEAH box helicase, partial [Candidatus Parvarchaeota archaeon]|nr:DEAD/DEAH box helicase [Candidatus Parvarchaeota archaeon]
MRFDELRLDERIQKALQQMGFESATEIQEKAIPLLLQGEDIVGQAKTGTGKTAAFGIHILEQIAQSAGNEGRHGAHFAGTAGHSHAAHGKVQARAKPRKPEALILAPTRELAVQIKDEIAKIGKLLPMRMIAVYGGVSIEPQIGALQQGVNIVVGTPGRILDHIERRTLDLSEASVVVLDEADRMLDMGFIEDIEKILGQTPHSRQTLLFSATMPPEILGIAKRYMKNPVHLNVSEDELVVDKIAQVCVEVTKMNKLNTLLSVLKAENPKLALVFTRTKFGADKLMTILHERGFEAQALHGDMSQNKRDRAMDAFKRGHVHVLVATDLASRGLDVKGITHVINYDLPEEIETYVHRIGRTGRMEATGKAISLLFPDQRDSLRLIERKTGAKVTQTTYPHIEVPRVRSAQGRFGGREREGFGQRPGRFGGRQQGDRRQAHRGFGGQGREGFGQRQHGRFGNRHSGGHPSAGG